MTKALLKYLENVKDRVITRESRKVNDTLSNKDKVVEVIKISEKTVTPKKVNDTLSKVDRNAQYKVIVKLWMTKPGSVNFTFHTLWNDNKEMPFRIMYGTILEECKTMIKMNLHASITETDYCLKCGKPLTNEISKLYGLGPECGEHYYINPLSKEEFEKYKEAVEQKLNNITWEGWIPKIAIISLERC